MFWVFIVSKVPFLGINFAIILSFHRICDANPEDFSRGHCGIFSLFSLENRISVRYYKKDKKNIISLSFAESAHSVVCNILSWRFDDKIFSTVILFLLLIQERQLSVSGERMFTILVNRFED